MKTIAQIGKWGLIMVVDLVLLALIYTGYIAFNEIELPFHSVVITVEDFTTLPAEMFKDMYPHFHFLLYPVSRATTYLYFLGILAAITWVFMLTYKRVSKNVRKLLIQIYLPFFLLFMIEILLRTTEVDTNNSKNTLYFNTHFVSRQYTFSDSTGINRLLNNRFIPINYRVNKQGFNSPYAFTRKNVERLKANGEVVMLIGDSFVEGCCPENGKSSFAQILDSVPQQSVLNFGIGGTDPLQYELIASQYVPELMPDMVVVCLTFSNDFVPYTRKPSPGIPIHYQSNKGFIFSQFPIAYGGEPNVLFHSGVEAWESYKELFSIYGKNATWPEKLGRQLILTAGVLSNLKKYRREKFNSKIRKPEYTASNLLRIQSICDSLNVPLIFTAIPSRQDVANHIAIEKLLGSAIPVKLSYPEELTMGHYETGTGGHFNAAGHKFYASFIQRQINGTLRQNHQGFSKSDLSKP